MNSVTTKVLTACFDPAANVELGTEVQGCAQPIRFCFNECIWMRIQLCYSPGTGVNNKQ